MPKFRRSLALSFIDKYITFVFSIVTIVILARILTPAQTGIFSVAVGLVNLAQTIREFGVCNYILKEAALSREKLATALGLSLLSGIGLALAFASMSGWIARWFEEPEIKSVVLVMSMNFVIVAFASIGWAQLQRKMDFSAMTRISITAVIVRSAVGIGMAYLGYGAMAMAWSSIAGTVISLVGSSIALGREGLIMPRLSAWRPLIRFGAASTGASLLQMVIFSAPDIIVGRLLGLTQAGFLSRARSLTTLFENGFMAAIRPVAVTSLAQASREGRAMGELYLKFLDHTIVIAWPILLLLAVLVIVLLNTRRNTQAAKAAAATPPGYYQNLQ